MNDVISEVTDAVDAAAEVVVSARRQLAVSTPSKSTSLRDSASPRPKTAGVCPVCL